MGEQIGPTTTQTARKSHDCWWCGEEITPGTTYSKWSWADEGTVATVKVHLECQQAWSKAACDNYGDYECHEGEHERGCTCEKGRCECKT